MRELFDKLSSELEQTSGVRLSSNPCAAKEYPQYDTIIAMDNLAIQYILEDMGIKDKQQWWHMCALHDLLPNVNPMKDETHRGKFYEIINDWRVWGKENGYL